MLDRQSLLSLLQLNIEEESPCFIIYSDIKSNRLNYVCEFIFSHVLNVSFKITHSFSEFELSDSFKINYSNKIGYYRIPKAELLFETGVYELKPSPFFENDTIYFFQNNQQKNPANQKFDLFASVFYFVSRYEEWQFFEADIHQRFEAKASLLFQNNSHLKPFVDIWIHDLKTSLEQFYPTLQFPKKKFKVISTIDVDNLYAYKSKGFLRTIGAMLKDIIKFDLKNSVERIKVLSKQRKDPFDIYDSVSQFCLEKKIPLFYFFLFRSGTKYDRTVDPSSGAFQKVFQKIKGKNGFIGLHPSYYSSSDESRMQKEISDFSKKLSERITFSRHHFLRFDIKTTPNILTKNGILIDFSMGFASTPGFRAGTSHPFYYYDFSKENRSELLFVPFCVMDGAYFVYSKTNVEKAFESIYAIALEIKKTDGLFVSIFHERTFSDHLYKGFGTLYKNLHQKLTEI